MAADRELRVKITTEADTSAVDKETAALEKLTAQAAKAKSAVEQVGKAKPASDDAWVQEQLQQTRRMADDLGRQRAGAGSVIDSGSSAKDFDAMAAGMRAAKGDGEGMIGMVGRLGQGLTVARVALFGFVGLLAGGTLAAIAGFVGWIAKGTAATPQFTAGLDRLRDSTRGVGNELSRTAAPLTDFLGKASGVAMSGFAGILDNTRDALRGFNDAGGEGAARAAEAEDAMLAYAAAARNLTTNLEGVAKGLHAANVEFEQNERRAKAATTAANEQTEATTKLRLAQIDLAQASGKITPAEAESQRLEVKGHSQEEIDKRNLDAANRTVETANPQAIAARKAENAAAEKVAMLQEALRKAENAPRETLAQTRIRLEEERARRPAIAGQINPIADEEQVRISNETANAIPNKAISEIKRELEGALAAEAKVVAYAKKWGDELLAAKNTAAALKIQTDANATGRAADTAKLEKKQAEDLAKEKIEGDKKANEARIEVLEKESRKARVNHELEMLAMREAGATSDQIAEKREAYARSSNARETEIAKLRGQDTAPLADELKLDLARIDSGRDRAARQDGDVPATRVPRDTRFPFARNGGAGGLQRHLGTDGIEIGQGSKDDDLYMAGSRLGTGVGPQPSRPNQPANSIAIAGDSKQAGEEFAAKLAAAASEGAAQIKAAGDEAVNVVKALAGEMVTQIHALAAGAVEAGKSGVAAGEAGARAIDAVSRDLRNVSSRLRIVSERHQ